MLRSPLRRGLGGLSPSPHDPYTTMSAPSPSLFVQNINDKVKKEGEPPRVPPGLPARTRD